MKKIHKNISTYNYCKYLLKMISIFSITGCQPETTPTLPINISHSLLKANNISEFNIEYHKVAGLGIFMKIKCSTEADLIYLLTLLSGRSPGGVRDLSIEEKGIPIPIHIQITDLVNNKIITDEISISQNVSSYNQKSVSRPIYGRVLPIGKYKVKLTNLNAHSIINFPTLFSIPGESKV